ncbi:RDD family protein [Halalkalibacter sp. APA_J-10(15)]|uniref:RDD family protein n=1 Tax=unclassified Halalkalibacter TaxID=2893063 RepID=UPI001FF3D79F|nr:RDD family protein [Halalkalibacter sp. APA_J-10(15)]MCK0471051.1 RDD family protein [Halalkalibacter sp. APA_J-10(15)]
MIPRQQLNATFPLRLKAFMIDYLFILIYMATLFIISTFLFPNIQELYTHSLFSAQLTGFFMLTVPVSVYFIIFDSNIVGQSIGKKKLGIKVVNHYGEAISLSQSALRVILKFLPWELSHFLVYRLIYIGDGDIPFLYTIIGILIYALIFAYLLTAIFTNKKQSLYDLIVKTEVIQTKSYSNH